MHPFVHRKDVPIKDYSRELQQFQGVQGFFFKKISAFFTFLIQIWHENIFMSKCPVLDSES
jgi:hypothetical protein